jgi:hypothetical protein
VARYPVNRRRIRFAVLAARTYTAVDHVVAQRLPGSYCG